MRSADIQEEWRRGWPVPFAGMIGLSGATIIIYSAGVFAPVFDRTFGWSRTEFFTGFAIITLVSMIALPTAGRIIDRFGPRQVGLTGIPVFAAVISSFALMRGPIMEYWLLCTLYAAAGSLVAHPTWTTAVASWFRASRGLAFAITLSSIGVGATIWPVLATLFNDRLGWRIAYPAMALSWLAMTLPLAIAFLRTDAPADDRARAAGPASGIGFGRAIRSWPFIALALSGALFSLMLLPVTVFFMPILRGKGVDATAAAGAAAVIGIAAIVGRIAIGYLIDRLSARLIGVVLFVMPVIAVLLLLGASITLPMAILAAILIGLAMGAEMDVVTYLIARFFGLKAFASIYGLIVGLFGVASSVGPLIGGRIFDLTGSYRPFLLAMIPTVLLAAAIMALLPRLPNAFAEDSVR